MEINTRQAVKEAAKMARFFRAFTHAEAVLTKLAGAEDALITAKSDVRVANEEVRQLNEKRGKLTGTVEALETKIKELEAQVPAAEQTVKDAEDSAHARVEELEKKYSAAYKVHVKNMSELYKKKESVVAAIKAGEEHVEKLNTKAARIANALAEE